MDFNVKHLHLILGCLIIGLSNYQLTEALQCYVCDNCVDGTELQEIQICGELPFEPTTQAPSSAAPTQSTNSSTTVRPTTVAPAPFQTGTTTNAVNRTVSSIASSTVTTRATTTRRPIITTTRRPVFTTTRRTTTPEDSDEDDSDYEESDEDDRKRRMAVVNAPIDDDFHDIALTKKHPINSPKQFEPVCFMVKFRVNNTQVTNLGCTSMIRNNMYLTCQSLNRSGAVMEDCQLCGRNGCNKLFFGGTDDDNGDEFPWSSGSSKMKLQIINFFVILLLAKLLN